MMKYPQASIDKLSASSNTSSIEINTNPFVTATIILDEDTPSLEEKIKQQAFKLVSKQGLTSLKNLLGANSKINEPLNSTNRPMWNTPPYNTEVPVPSAVICLLDFKNKKMHYLVGSDKIWNASPSQVKVFNKQAEFFISYNSNSNLLANLWNSIKYLLKNNTPSIEGAYAYAYTTTSDKKEVKGLILQKIGK